MQDRVRLILSTLACGAIMLACAQKRTQPLAQSAQPSQASAPVAAAGPAGADAPPEKEKQPRFGESVVYVDGKPVGVVRASELPAGLKARHIDLGEGYHTTRYGFLDYARAVGVDVKRIKAMHLYGGTRVAVIEKDELARLGDQIEFAFTRGDAGKPRVDWPAKKIRVNTKIDMVSSVAFYVEKEPPTLEGRTLVMPDGTPVGDKVPYAPEEQGNGTRVYLDGVLVGTVKRKKITDDLLVADAKAKIAASADDKSAEADRFSLLGYAEKLRAGAKQAKTVDLVAGDDVVAQLSPDEAKALTFHVPARNRGQAVVDVPEKGADGAVISRRARISAVQIYVNTKPPVRPVVKIDEAPAAAVGSGQGGAGADDEL